jgi:crotonobetainyl-CoA:carnitine CoA-transferase CaiB-like acyl-CoA transferase
MTKPLEGYKVIEIAQEIQGPFASMMLAYMGASVVKVEHPASGDLSRWMFTSLIGGPQVNNPQVSHYFIAMNQAKRSITLDLKKLAAVEVVRRMAASYDVLVTNYRPGVLDRLGLGYDELLRINPKIVYAQGSSWGPKGPWVRRPSRDTLAQAASGLMAKTGMPGDPPLPAGIMAADHSGAISLAGGIFAGLLARERTGKGQKVDVSIYGTLLAMQGFEIDYTSLSGREPQRAGRSHGFLQGVWGAFRTADGYLCLAGVDDGRWPRFCRILGMEKLEKEPGFDNIGRNVHGERVRDELDKIFPTRTTAQWLAQLNAADILVTEVADYQSLLENEQARANGYIRDLDHPAAGTVRVSGQPIIINEEVESTAAMPPELGQHTEEVLLELGYSWEEIDQLRGTKVI